MSSFSVKAHLSEVYGISCKGGGKAACPFCTHLTMSVAKSDLMAKCFHPTCGKIITQMSVDGDKKPTQAFLTELAGRFNAELIRQSIEPEDFHSMAWRYLVNERKILPEVLRESPVGVVPEGLDIQAMAAPYQEKLEKALENQTLTQRQRARYENALNLFKTLPDKLEGVLKPGNIAFLYTNTREEILSIRFRAPFTKNFAMFKPFNKAGVFAPQLEPGKSLATKPFLMLVEGEFNALTLQSTLHNAGRPYEACLALGSSSSVDWQTLKEYKGKWLLFQDHDEAGDKLAEEMQARRTFWLTQAHLPGADLDSFLRDHTTPKAAISALETLIKEAKTKYRFIESIAEELHKIRQNRLKLKEFEVSQQVSQLIIEEMNARGVFYKTRLMPYYFDSETLRLSQIHKESQGMIYFLHRLKLNPVETLHGYVLKELINEAYLNGKLTEVHDLYHYDIAKNTLYWANGNQNILKITMSQVESLPNGTDGFLFIENSRYTTFNRCHYDPERDYLDDLLLTQANFNEDAMLYVDEQRLVLRYYFLSLFFSSLMKTRPLLCPVAEKGSGKTSLLRRIGQLLMGPGFDVTPLPEKQQDFQVALAHHYFLAFDNVDESCKWLNDTLAICATGGTIRMRTLYTTAEETEIPIRSFVALNSRTPNFRRDDVAERLLLLRLKPWGNQKRLEGELNRELLDTRDAFLSWMVVQLQDILKALAVVSLDGFRTEFRIADFAGFCYRIAKYNGQDRTIQNLFSKLANAQAEFTLENDPLFDCIQLFAEQNPGRWIDSRSLHRELATMAEKHGIYYPIKNAQSLGKQLKRLQSCLSRVLHVETERRGGNVTWYRFSPNPNPLESL